MSKILISGGAGFIGSAVVPFLQSKGHDVFVYDNLSFGSREFINVSDDHFSLGDIRDKELLTKTVKKIQPEIVIHLAAIHFIPYCNQNPVEAVEVNVMGTHNLINAVKQLSGLKKILFASTAAVYPIIDEPITEDHETGPMDIYGITKVIGEELCEKFYMETKIDTIACRFFNAFGPNETNPHLIPEIEKQIKNGNRTIELGNLTPKRDFIHTYDMANAVYSLLNVEIPAYNVYNLGRGIEYSVTDIVKTFEIVIGEKININVAPERVRKVERMHLLADVKKLTSHTSWKPEWSIEEGIKDLVNKW